MSMRDVIGLRHLQLSRLFQKSEVVELETQFSGLQGERCYRLLRDFLCRWRNAAI
jgi:hypothetical protein